MDKKSQSSKAVKVIDLPNSRHKGHLVRAEIVTDKPNNKPKTTFPTQRQLFFGVILVVLLVLIWFFVVFLPNQYRFSFNLGGVDYYSNEYTPKEFFKLTKDSSRFIVGIDLIENNTDPWMVNSMNLWVVGLTADKKQVITLIKTLDQYGGLVSCITNDGNILSSRNITIEECNSLELDPTSLHINVHIGSENKVILFKNSAEIYSQKGNLESRVNYSVIQNIYPDFNRTLAIINEKINSTNVDINIKK